MMAPVCDRCKTPHVQVVQVLGKDLCNACIGDVRGFIEAPPLHRGASKRTARIEAALRLCAAVGRVTDVQIAQINQEPVRTAYHRLMALARTDRLVHVGKGVFVMPRPWAAE